MALEDYRQDMETCCRCSACKFIPMENVRGIDHAYVCPSISRYNFHAYSGGGRMGIGVALLDKEIEFSPKLQEIIYNCQMCGGCDVSCKYAMDMDVFEPISEMRIVCAESGWTLPSLEKVIRLLRRSGHMATAGKDKKWNWYDGLDVKDYTLQKVDVVFHAGCRTAADSSLWPVARAAISLLQAAGINVGIAGAAEQCCGGRAYYMGYKSDFLKQAEENTGRLVQTGASVLVTACAECYQAFRVLYDRFGFKPNMEILHATEFLLRLVRDGKIKPRNRLDLTVTYHDPCYLGRLGEPWIHWSGRLRPGQIRLFDPPREFRRGTYGVYKPPRELLGCIPGLKLVEMDRRQEYAWCCGAGGGVKESNPEFALWTARERLREARATGATAIVTACPGCEKNFQGAQQGREDALPVFDAVELLARASL